MNNHEVGKCDICHKPFKFLETGHGYIYGINSIVRYCEECWIKENSYWPKDPPEMPINKEDKLDAIFRMQAVFAKQIEERGQFPVFKDDQVEALCTAIIHEAVELQDLTEWKWWKTYKGFNEREAREELIDIFHFVIHTALVLGMTPDELLKEYQKKMEVNKQRQKQGY